MNRDSRYLGMTVNERLYVSGLIDKFYESVKKKDINAAVFILKAVDLGEENIKAILKFNDLIQDEFE
jgi:truncated hemoglobin YjbI